MKATVSNLGALMLCSRCGEREASVLIVNGAPKGSRVKSEQIGEHRRLCSVCAEELLDPTLVQANEEWERTELARDAEASLDKLPYALQVLLADVSGEAQREPPDVKSLKQAINSVLEFLVTNQANGNAYRRLVGRHLADMRQVSPELPQTLIRIMQDMAGWMIDAPDAGSSRNDATPEKLLQRLNSSASKGEG